MKGQADGHTAITTGLALYQVSIYVAAYLPDLYRSTAALKKRAYNLETIATMKHS